MTALAAPALAPGALDAGEPTAGHQGLLRSLWRSPNGRAGLVLVGVVVAAAIAAAFGGTPYNPLAQNPAALLAAP
ncbi:MAG: hypothetical protein ABR972_14115, partial [Acidimicrobiales bacterium]